MVISNVLLWCIWCTINTYHIFIRQVQQARIFPDETNYHHSHHNVCALKPRGLGVSRVKIRSPRRQACRSPLCSLFTRRSTAKKKWMQLAQGSPVSSVSCGNARQSMLSRSERIRNAGEDVERSRYFRLFLCWELCTIMAGRWFHVWRWPQQNLVKMCSCILVYIVEIVTLNIMWT